MSSTATSGTAISVLPGAQTEASCLSYNFTSGSYTLTFLTTSTHSAGNVTFSGFTGTLNALSTVQLFKGLTITPTSATMTWSTSTNALTFAATSGTWDINTNGKAMDQPIIFGAGAVSGGTWRLLSNFVSGTSTTASTRLTTLTIGTLNLNNFTYIGGTFSSSSSNARTIAFGTGNITLVASGGTMWTTATLTGFAITGIPTVNVSNSSATATTITTGAMTETTQAVDFNFTTGTYALTLTAGNKGNLRFTGYTGTVGISAQTIYGDLVITTAPALPTTAVWTLGGTAAIVRNINFSAATTLPILVWNAPAATFTLQSNFTTTAAKFAYNNGNINLNNYNFNIDTLSLIPSGTCTLSGGTIGGKFNVSGTSGNVVLLNAAFTLVDNNVSVYLTAPTGANRTVGIGTGGTNGYGVSLYFANATTDTVTLNGLFGNIDTTGFNGTLTNASNAISLYGNLYIASTTTLSPSASGTISLRGTLQQYTIGSASGNITLSSALNLSGGNYKLNSNVTMTNYLGLQTSGSNGALDLNGKTLTAASYFSVGGSNNVITMSNGTINITGNDAANSTGALGVWDNETNPGSLNFTGTGIVTFTSASAKSISGSTTFPTLNQGGSGTLYIRGACICNDITTTVVPSTISVNILTATNFSLSGTASGQITLNSVNTGTQATISKASGTVSASYLTIKDIIATGGAVWNAFTSNGNVNNGNNSGWNFGAAVATLYRGIKSRAQAYLGIRTDGQLYKGVRTIGWV